jgi:hypothetical protein
VAIASKRASELVSVSLFASICSPSPQLSQSASQSSPGFLSSVSELSLSVSALAAAAAAAVLCLVLANSSSQQSLSAQEKKKGAGEEEGGQPAVSQRVYYKAGVHICTEEEENSDY